MLHPFDINTSQDNLAFKFSEYINIRPLSFPVNVFVFCGVDVKLRKPFLLHIWLIFRAFNAMDQNFNFFTDFLILCICYLLIRCVFINDHIDRIFNHCHHRTSGICFFKDSITFCVNQFTLLIVYFIKFQDILSCSEVIILNHSLCFLDKFIYSSIFKALFIFHTCQT